MCFGFVWKSNLWWYTATQVSKPLDSSDGKQWMYQSLFYEVYCLNKTHAGTGRLEAHKGQIKRWNCLLMQAWIKKDFIESLAKRTSHDNNLLKDFFVNVTIKATDFSFFYWPSDYFLSIILGQKSISDVFVYPTYKKLKIKKKQDLRNLKA